MTKMTKMTNNIENNSEAKPEIFGFTPTTELVVWFGVACHICKNVIMTPKGLFYKYLQEHGNRAVFVCGDECMEKWQNHIKQKGQFDQ